MIDNLVGKKLKSKINGRIFLVDGEFKDGNDTYYSVLDLASGEHIATLKDWFHSGFIQNLEVIDDDGQ